MAFLRRAATTLAALAAFAVAGALPAWAAPTFAPTEAKLTNVGALASDVGGSRYWAINATDSSVYGLNADGSVAGKVALGVTPTGAEAMVKVDTTLYIGDIGGKAGAKRSAVVVYGVTNPTPGKTVTPKTYKLSYGDKTSHDAGTMLATASGALEIITTDGAAYQLPSALKTTGTNTMTRLSDAPAGIIDGVTLSDGRVALRSADTLYLCDALTLAVLTQQAIDGQPAGGTVVQSLDGTSLILAPESFKTGTAVTIPVPSATPAPTATETPSASASPSPSVSPTSDPSDTSGAVVGKTAAEQAAALDKSGSVIALLGAGIVAVLGGVFVLFKR